ncbi:hypothetical protein [Paraburkholderia humisilvae]|uniref:hypothetical protein n=1 Tax=Paraburkholderia humisilvae TaxID=627669 RepID=UPI0035F0FA3E
MTFYRRALLKQLVLLEADPLVITVSERPGYIQINGHDRLADLWVRYIDLNELVIPIYYPCKDDGTKSVRNPDVQTFSIKKVVRAELAAARA